MHTTRAPTPASLSMAAKRSQWRYTASPPALQPLSTTSVAPARPIWRRRATELLKMCAPAKWSLMPLAMGVSGEAEEKDAPSQ